MSSLEPSLDQCARCGASLSPSTPTCERCGQPRGRMGGFSGMPIELMKSVGIGLSAAALLSVVLWLGDRSSGSHPAEVPAAEPIATPHAKVHTRRTPRPLTSDEILRLHEAEAPAAEAMGARLNKRLGVHFVQGTRIDHGTLTLTIDGNIWENQSDEDRIALYQEMASGWNDVYAKYERVNLQKTGLRLYDLDGTELHLEQK